MRATAMIKRRAAGRRAGRLLASLLAVLAAAAVAASSASAFSWWTGNPKSPEMLGEGVRLPINAAGTEKAPLTFKWFGAYEIECTGVTYNSLFLEGPVFLGAASFTFEGCTSTKPAEVSLVGTTVETAPLYGEISPAGAKVDFALSPGKAPLASFTLAGAEGCELNVTIEGSLDGQLTQATKITNEKEFKFDSFGQLVKQSKGCGTDSRRKGGKKKHKEEGEGKVEGGKGGFNYSAESGWGVL